jgi:hypothetical protein
MDPYEAWTTIDRLVEERWLSLPSCLMESRSILASLSLPLCIGIQYKNGVVESLKIYLQAYNISIQFLRQLLETLNLAKCYSMVEGFDRVLLNSSRFHKSAMISVKVSTRTLNLISLKIEIPTISYFVNDKLAREDFMNLFRNITLKGVSMMSL